MWSPNPASSAHEHVTNTTKGISLQTCMPNVKQPLSTNKRTKYTHGHQLNNFMYLHRKHNYRLLPSITTTIYGLMVSLCSHLLIHAHTHVHIHSHTFAQSYTCPHTQPGTKTITRSPTNSPPPTHSPTHSTPTAPVHASSCFVGWGKRRNPVMPASHPFLRATHAARKL